MIYEQRNHNGERVDTVRIPIEPTPELLQTNAQEGYTEFLECYLVMYKPPEAEVLKDKLTEIADALPDNLAAQHPEIYEKLKENGASVPANKRINWHGVVMKAKVTLWDRPDQNPENAPELWDKLVFGEAGYRVIPETITTELAFGKDEIGFWPKDGKHYKAVRDGVVHNPEVYPRDWEEVQV